MGFRIWYGTSADETQTIVDPLDIEIIYNSCMCWMSYFLGDTPPADMVTRAVGAGDFSQQDQS